MIMLRNPKIVGSFSHGQIIQSYVNFGKIPLNFELELFIRVYYETRQGLSLYYILGKFYENPFILFLNFQYYSVTSGQLIETIIFPKNF